MPRLKYDSDSDEASAPVISTTRKAEQSHRERSLRELLGGGRVADILLWKNKNLSAGILVAATLAWFLFEVVEYHFLTLLCHVSITAMLVVFIWSNGAPLIDRDPPKISEVIVSEAKIKEVAKAFNGRLSKFVSLFYKIACGKDLKLFLLAIGSLWILSVLGSYCSFISLLYLGFLCLHTLPALYKHYETEVDHLANKSSQDLKKFYKKLDSKVLDKIPRAPGKDKKRK
ncbi:reticulon-like protein B9 [Typha latifolia]|uniref:reticulon-like protein B9 n=1 Tax=Typha latifolia TaxID=4733 RepID=UPI003C2E7FF6